MQEVQKHGAALYQQAASTGANPETGATDDPEVKVKEADSNSDNNTVDGESN